MRPRGSEIFSVAVAAICAAGIGFVQPGLSASVRKIHLTDDTTALPPPDQLRAMTFGYRSATADILWATVLMEHGTHTQEKRAWRGLTRYLDGILALEPDHPTLFRFVDALITFKPGEQAGEADARFARSYLELGTKQRPYDPERWLNFGQFIAFLAPSFLKDEAEIERWRTEGAFAMGKAVELGSDPDRSLAVATLLGKAGEKKAAIQQLRRAFALTDDVAKRQQFLFRLQKLEAIGDVESTVSYVENEWRTRYPFLSRGTALLIGPYRSPAACAGPGVDRSRTCPPDWAAATGGER